MNSTNSWDYRLLYISWACSLHLWVLWLYRVFIHWQFLWAMNVVMTLYECSYDTSVQPYLNLIQFLLFFRPEILAGWVIHTQCDLLYGNLCMCVCVCGCVGVHVCVCVRITGRQIILKWSYLMIFMRILVAVYFSTSVPIFGRSFKPLTL